MPRVTGEGVTYSGCISKGSCSWWKATELILGNVKQLWDPPLCPPKTISVSNKPHRAHKPSCFHPPRYFAAECLMHFHSKYLSGIHDQMSKELHQTLMKCRRTVRKALMAETGSLQHSTQAVSLPSNTCLHFKSQANTRRTSSWQLLHHTRAGLCASVAT